jgi:hypothetical protein
VVHLLRNSFRHAGRQDWESVRAQARCRSVALLQAGSVLGAPAAVVGRTWTGRTDDDASARRTAHITLASYASEEAARKVTAALAQAADDCAEGFAYEAPGARATDRAITRVLAPQGADEAMALTAGLGRTEKHVSLVLAREGATAVHITVTSTGGTAELPEGLVETQLMKPNR